MDEQRAEFEAWAKQAGWSHSWGYSNTNKIGFCSASWNVWQAATQRQQERIAELERDLKFVERWANHHGAKPHTTAESALSVIQHYPPITAITRGYADGVVPDTFDPYARIAELQAQVQALSLDAGRLDWLTFHLSGKALRDIGVIWSEHADARAAIDAAIARATHKEQT